MQVSTEKKEGLKHLITITVPAADVKNYYKQALAKIAKSARIDGFRKGHVPTKVLEQRFAYDIISEAHELIFKNTLYKAIDETKLKVIDRPELSLVDNNFDLEKDFSYTALVEVEPEVVLKDLAELKLKHFKSEITDADVEKMIGNLREQQGKWQVKDDLVISNDTLARIAFKLSVDGEEVKEGGSSDDFAVQPGKTSLIPGFAEQLIGHKAGESFVIKATFPTPYQSKDLEGKEGSFDITVNTVSERVLPEVNEDFVKVYGIKEGGVEAFRDALRKNMQRELNKALYAKTRDSLYDALAEQYKDLEVPTVAVAEETKRLQDNMKQQIKAQFGFTPKDDMVKAENFKDQAETNARLGFIIRAFEEELKLSPSKELVDSLIAEYAEAFEDSKAVVESLKKDKKAMSNFLMSAYEHQIVDALMEKACDGEETLTFEELTSRQ